VDELLLYRSTCSINWLRIGIMGWVRHMKSCNVSQRKCSRSALLPGMCNLDTYESPILCVFQMDRLCLSTDVRWHKRSATVW
jgi:hypothetical protein